jgi:hypothetical protein
VNEQFDTARAWVTLYLSSSHSELRDEIAVFLRTRPHAHVAKLLEVLVAGIGETFGSREEWSVHIIEVMRQHDSGSDSDLGDEK